MDEKNKILENTSEKEKEEDKSFLKKNQGIFKRRKNFVEIDSYYSSNICSYLFYAKHIL